MRSGNPTLTANTFRERCLDGNQVHDELIFDMEPSEEAELHELVSQGMIGALELPCPIEI